jgi:signal transduction histidine kinase
MTIRYRLLFSYLLISLTSSILITAMFFIHFSQVLTEEVESDLKLEALSMMQEIDWHLFERIQNILIWEKLEVMQDIRVRDIDKRLSYFLREMCQGYQGTYKYLLTLDSDEQLIAVSDVKFNLPIPDIHLNTWQRINIDSQTLYMQPGSLINNFFYLSIPVKDKFLKGLLGYLHAAIDWEGIYRILETPLPFLQNNEASYTFVVDQNNKIIAASHLLRQSGFLFTQLPDAFLHDENHKDVHTINWNFLNSDQWVVAEAKSTGHRSYKGLGWRVLVMHPADNALKSIYQLWQYLLIFICFTTLLASILSLWSAQRIAKPIIQLAKFTRNFILGTHHSLPKITASGEVTELSEQFNLMITRLEKSQQDQVRMAKFATIAEMSATMAHEIRTPLGILRSSAQILNREKNLSPIAKEMIDFINSETSRLNSLVTTLLDSSRTQKIHRVKQDFIPVIDHMIELLKPTAEKQNIQLVFLKTELKLTFAYDWDQMVQVFLNLMMNAMQHISTEKGLIEISLFTEKNNIIIQLSDNGTGISDANKALVFEPFYTARKEGIGLGLMVVQQIIKAHQGEIMVTDSLSGGACFTIKLPINSENKHD